MDGTLTIAPGSLPDVERYAAEHFTDHPVILAAVAPIARQAHAEAVRLGDPMLAYGLLYGAVDILWDIRNALAPPAKEDAYHRWLWRHAKGWPDPRNLDAYQPDKGMLEHAAAEYLARPWMSSGHLDWVPVDALTRQEILAYETEVARAIGPVRWSVAWWVTKALLVGIPWLTEIGIAAGTAWWLWSEFTEQVPHRWWWAAGAGVYYAWAISRAMWTYPTRRRLRKARREELLTIAERIGAMRQAYDELAGPVLDPTRILDMLLATENLEVRWSRATWPLLDNAISRHPHRWMTIPYA